VRGRHRVQPSIATRSRYESLYWRYQRTHKTMISASKWRPLKTAARLSSLRTRASVHERSTELLPAALVCNRTLQLSLVAIRVRRNNPQWVMGLLPRGRRK
jgi:hypothetical protein